MNTRRYLVDPPTLSRSVPTDQIVMDGELNANLIGCGFILECEPLSTVFVPGMCVAHRDGDPGMTFQTRSGMDCDPTLFEGTHAFPSQ